MIISLPPSLFQIIISLFKKKGYVYTPGKESARKKLQKNARKIKDKEFRAKEVERLKTPQQKRKLKKKDGKG